jgi:protein-L-isoaspartate(D-aspartate) O-methyltransferase
MILGGLGVFSVVLLFWGHEQAIAQSRNQARWDAARAQMFETVIVGNGVTNEAVRASMRSTPRHEFIPRAQWKQAYLDMALPIGGGQTITSPFVVARMTEALNPQPTDRVLEIGTGSGYQAAVLSPIVAAVYSIEIVESLARRSTRTLKRLDYENVQTKAGDGYLGWPEHAPFDKIIVTCSPDNVPAPLVQQLREGGRMVIPLGKRYQQTLYVMRKVNGNLENEVLEPTFFVPMTGKAEQLRDNAGELTDYRLVNGNFEVADDQGQPQGWYYRRHAEVVRDVNALDGENVLRLHNDTPGQGAQVLQAIGIDGRRMQKIRLNARMMGEQLRAGQTNEQTPRIELTFYNQGRAPIKVAMLGPWTGTFDWKEIRKSISVPQQTRLAVLTLAMYGGVGELLIDQVDVQIVETD